ncbi:MAG: VOC family protein [Dietzia sp.]
MREPAPPSLFGNVHLGYVVIESRRLADWRRFGKDAIGMHVDDQFPGVVRFRLDHHEARFVVRSGPAEDVVALGWEIDDHASFDQILGRLTGHGVPLAEGTPEEAAIRGVERLVRFPGPNQLVQEIFTRARTTDRPLAMTNRGGFVTGESGMGHVAVTSTKPHQMRAFYNTVFDARLSDYIDETINGLKVKIRFLRVNQRHHSVAIANVRGLPIHPVSTRVQHLNIEVASLDDMTDAYQRVKQLGFDMALSIGQHTNDKELSFYAKTPSGFEWEVGWNPVLVDESTWEPTTHQGISIWGHGPEGPVAPALLGRVRSGVASLRGEKDSIPAVTGAGIPDS